MTEEIITVMRMLSAQRLLVVIDVNVDLVMVEMVISVMVSVCGGLIDMITLCNADLLHHCHLFSCGQT